MPIIGCLFSVLAVLVGVGSLVAHYAIKSPTSPYQVEFSTRGTACSQDDDSEDSKLVLDQETGEVLSCGVTGIFRDQGPFSAEEVRRITNLSEARASDGRLSDADRDAVRQLVAQISREHGYDKTSPTTLERLTWRVGIFSLIGGFAVVVVLGLWGWYVDSQTGPAAR